MRVRAAGGPRPKVDESLDAASPPSVKTPPASGPSSTTLWAARIVVRSSTSTDRGVFVRAPGLVSRHVRDQGGCVRFARPAAPGRGQVEPDFWPRDNIHGTKLRREYEACSYVGSGRALGRAGGWRGRTMVMMRAWLRPRGRIDSQRERRCSTRARDEMRTRRPPNPHRPCPCPSHTHATPSLSPPMRFQPARVVQDGANADPKIFEDGRGVRRSRCDHPTRYLPTYAVESLLFISPFFPFVTRAPAHPLVSSLVVPCTLQHSG
ncbi:hypothetical protein VFPBJ_05508 [Purpureocillium lilacinum]|uniref:Uncharacterized protein n=1 Tax=Purpureocillium lilacinum TaxID=33203 RepID=A0A179GRI7_PURLI|nr:hypothetical protein VFPBJ_05508 [Purpureocillium lilacinum]